VQSRDEDAGLRVLLVGLFSERYPAAGETHGLSVIAGAIHEEFSGDLSAFEVLDLVTMGKEEPDLVGRLAGKIHPHVFALSLPYGTYDSLRMLKPIIKGHIDRGGLMLVGGPLATYVGHTILDDIDDRLIVVQGEGDQAAPAAIRAWRTTNRFDNVPNLLFSRNGTKIATQRVLADCNSMSPPYRQHLRRSISQGIQVYAEASRGCSWAACTFCLRGLTDLKGTAREYRRLPYDRLRSDIRNLRALGADQLTFADEDFLGGDADSMSGVVEVMACLSAEIPERPLSFDISATTRSIVDESDGPQEASLKLTRLRQLKEAGLNKVFLGVESGSPAQLKRYAKGHTPAEIVATCQAVLQAEVGLELGFIMFDPLCTPEEIIENSTFLLDNGLATYVSGPTSELRLQVGSRYVNVLNRAERHLGQQLFKRDVDPNTLSHEYQYADSESGALAVEVRDWDRVVHPFVYATKGLTRHGKGVLEPDEHGGLKSLLGRYREGCLQALRTAAHTRDRGKYQAGTIPALTELVRAAQHLSNRGKESRHPMIDKVSQEAAHLAGVIWDRG
jgi:hypothetical protein